MKEPIEATLDDPAVAEELDLLAARVAGWQREGLRVVLCHGCFDPLHVGHLLHFQSARRQADRLVVTITPDRFVRDQKGEGRPLVPQDLRLAMVRALRPVDAAGVNLWPSALQTLDRLRPDAFAKGSEYRASEHPYFRREREALASWGGEIVFTDDWTTSSTRLIEWIEKC